MSWIFTVSVFLLLAKTKADTFQTECVKGPEEDLRQFILEHHKETRELLKLEIEALCTGLSESLNQKLQKIEFKMESSLQDLSDTFNHKLELSETRLLSELANQSEIIQRNHQQVSKPLVDFSQLVNNSQITTMLGPQTTVESVQVEELTSDSGTIEFDGGVDSHLLRKIWILQASRSTYFSSVSFVMEENNLGVNADITLWGDYGGAHVWNGSQADWRKEAKGNGFIILLTLTLKPRTTTDIPPGFKIKFKAIRTSSDFTHSNEIMNSDGIQSISFPPNNAQNYPLNSFFLSVIAPPSGREFSLTLKYLDIPCNNSPFYIYFLEDSPIGVKYKRQDSSAYGLCGRLGNISELLGRSSVAILRFWSSYPGGRGFRIEVNTN